MTNQKERREHWYKSLLWIMVFQIDLRFNSWTAARICPDRLNDDMASSSSTGTIRLLWSKFLTLCWKLTCFKSLPLLLFLLPPNHPPPPPSFLGFWPVFFERSSWSAPVILESSRSWAACVSTANVKWSTVCLSSSFSRLISACFKSSFSDCRLYS